MEKSSVSSAVIKSIILALLGAIVILGVYLMVTRLKVKPDKDEGYELTAVDEITTTNLDKNYPADARMVVEFYGKIMRTLYRETYTDSQQDKMIDILAGIMDDELLANQNNFSKSIKNEIKQKKDGDYSVVTYIVQAREPDVVKVDGRKMCSVECLFSLRKGTSHVPITYEFIMRQDEEGRWKILGWTLKDDE
ncbi:MAG: hypothetical protein IKO76_06855 [Butyrivibrio sp.]|nr:hypothetical protein [Butyrivibrio sp.]